MNAKQRQRAADLWPGPSQRTWAIGPPVGGYETHQPCPSPFIIKTFVGLGLRMDQVYGMGVWGEGVPSKLEEGSGVEPSPVKLIFKF